MDMDMLEMVMLCLLATLGVTTLSAWRGDSERRDVRLLAALTALAGAGATAAVVW